MIELKAYTYDDMIDGNADIDVKYYSKEDVDAAIAELKCENERINAKLETVNDLVKASRKFLDDAMEAPTFQKDKEIARLKESVKFFSDTLHRESDSAKKCFSFLMNQGLIAGWGLTNEFFVTAKYSKERLMKFESQEAEIRKLRRALWLARADRAIMTLEYFTIKCKWFQDYMKVEPPKCDVKMIHKWANVERKCRAKAEEYK